MFTQTCPDCNGKFSHERETTSKQMLSRHRAKVHGVISPKAQYERDMRAKKAATEAEMQATKLKSLEKARAARWAGHHVYKTPTVQRQKALDRYYARKAKEEYPEATRTQLQQSSWWQVEGNNKPITCPCCSAQFVIIKGS